MLAGTKERVSDYLEALIESEEALADLYRACARAWPGERTFWQGLADEELDHALRLDLVRERVLKTSHGVGLLRPYPAGTIQSFLALVRKDTEEVLAGRMTNAVALYKAMHLEQSLIESQPLRGFSFDDPRFAPYWQSLTAHGDGHARRLAARAAQVAPAHARAS